MRIHIIDVRRGQAGTLQGHLHGAEAAIAVFRRCSDVEGIARQAVTLHLAVDLRAARLGMFVFL